MSQVRKGQEQASELRASFGADLGHALAAWRSQPWFLVLVAVVPVAGVAYRAFLAEMPPIFILFLVWPWYLFLCGFAGAEWFFYLRVDEGRRLPMHLLPKVTKKYVGRFFRLGLIVVGVVAIALLALELSLHASRQAGHSSQLPSWYLLAAIGAALFLDAMLTFVGPCLAYSTDSALDALRTGLRFLRTSWPASALYVLTPGITLGAIALVLPPSDANVETRMVIGAVGAVTGFLFKGAIAPFYLRAHTGPMDRLKLWSEL
jgi:hypothetical protein